MIELEDKINITNPDWQMSCREKLSLIGLLQCLKPKKVIEFGFHRGGATKWLSQFAEKLISVDVNEFVSETSKKCTNVEAWRCTTAEAIKKIKTDNPSFDLDILDADQSRRGVSNDVSGILPHTEVILMHDSFNPACRRGMLDALKSLKQPYILTRLHAISAKRGRAWGRVCNCLEIRKSRTQKRIFR